MTRGYQWRFIFPGESCGLLALFVNLSWRELHPMTIRSSGADTPSHYHIHMRQGVETKVSWPAYRGCWRFLKNGFKNSLLLSTSSKRACARHPGFAIREKTTVIPSTRGPYFLGIPKRFHDSSGALPTDPTVHLWREGLQVRWR